MKKVVFNLPPSVPQWNISPQGQKWHLLSSLLYWNSVMHNTVWGGGTCECYGFILPPSWAALLHPPPPPPTTLGFWMDTQEVVGPPSGGRFFLLVLSSSSCSKARHLHLWRLGIFFSSVGLTQEIFFPVLQSEVLGGFFFSSLFHFHQLLGCPDSEVLSGFLAALKSWILITLQEAPSPPLSH